MASSVDVDTEPAFEVRSDPLASASADAEGGGNRHTQNHTWAVSVTNRKSDSKAATTASGDTKTESNGDASAVDDLKPAAGLAKKFHLHDVQSHGPSTFFNPTNVHMHIKWRSTTQDSPIRNDGTSSGPSIKDSPNQELAILWRSRDNRKGRGSIALPVMPRDGSKAVPVSPRGGSLTMRLGFPLRDVGKNLLRMCTTFPYWDMAFWSGWSYSIGSVLFVIDGAWAWGPLAFPSTAWPGEAEYGVPLCFFFGTLFYEIGATMAYFEAVNDGSFAGSALRRFLEGHGEDQKKLLDEKLRAFFGHLVPHHGRGRDEGEEAEKQEQNIDPEAGWKNKDKRRPSGAIYPRSTKSASRRGGVDFGEAQEGESVEYLAWRWYPTWHRFRTHHIREIGYISCVIQLCGATLYGMCGIVLLPGILSSLSQWQQNAAYWIPQIVASVGFLTAGFGFTLETQVKWYKPEPTVLGWWIGFWAVVGSMGFLLCGSLGPASYSSTGAAYQSGLSSMWGSAAYLLSSLLQWYEAVNKHPVSRLFTELGDMDMTAPASEETPK